MKYLQYALQFFHKVGKFVGPMIIGYEINEIVDEQVHNQDIVKYIHVNKIENDQKTFIRDILLGALIVSFFMAIGVKLYLDHKRQNSRPEQIELANL